MKSKAMAIALLLIFLLAISGVATAENLYRQYTTVVNIDELLDYTVNPPAANVYVTSTVNCENATDLAG